MEDLFTLFDLKEMERRSSDASNYERNRAIHKKGVIKCGMITNRMKETKHIIFRYGLANEYIDSISGFGMKILDSEEDDCDLICLSFHENGLHKGTDIFSNNLKELPFPSLIHVLLYPFLMAIFQRTGKQGNFVKVPHFLGLSESDTITIENKDTNFDWNSECHFTIYSDKGVEFGSFVLFNGDDLVFNHGLLDLDDEQDHTSPLVFMRTVAESFQFAFGKYIAKK